MSDFVCCINNDSKPANQASLIVGKVYRTLLDAEAEADNKLRIIDEAKSEPDGYLYPATMFAPTSPPDVLVHCVHGTHPRGKWQQLLWNAKYEFCRLRARGKPCTPAFPLPHPDREKRCWFEPDSKLEDAVLKKLKDLGSDSCRVRFERFLWSGSNSFRARNCAAQELQRYLAEWHRELPQANHLILAHSHGGTVAVEAIDMIDEPAEPPAGCGDEPLSRVKAVNRTDKLVKGMMTLGTPFVRLVKRGPEQEPSRFYEAVGVSLPVISLLGALLLVIDVLQHATAASTTMWALLLLAFLALALRHVGLAAAVLVMVCFVGGFVVLTHLMFLGTIFVIIVDWLARWSKARPAPLSLFGINHLIQNRAIRLPCPLIAVRTPGDEASLVIGLGQALERLLHLCLGPLNKGPYASTANRQPRAFRAHPDTGAKHGLPAEPVLRVAVLVLYLLSGAVLVATNDWVPGIQGLSSWEALLLTFGAVGFLFAAVSLMLILAWVVPGIPLSFLAGPEALWRPAITGVDAEPLPFAQPESLMTLVIDVQAGREPPIDADGRPTVSLNHSLHDLPAIRSRIACWLRSFIRHPMNTGIDLEREILALPAAERERLATVAWKSWLTLLAPLVIATATRKALRLPCSATPTLTLAKLNPLVMLSGTPVASRNED